jgi:ring-1,2-phenylacetyl-CoA epoxidase subunit PaaC
VSASVPAPVSADARLGYVLRLADTSLILGQRLSEWVGHAPALEEDLGLANIALDLIGQARLLLSYAGEIEGRGRTEDELAFLRDAGEFMNLTLVEQPNGDFGRTLVRQLLAAAFQLELYTALQACTDPRLAEIAAKALKETSYHFRYSAGWVVRLGDGTPDSHARVQTALEELWPFTAELFASDSVDADMAATAATPRAGELKAAWSARIDAVLQEATLKRPADSVFPWHGKAGSHTEHLGYLLAEMQFLQRAYPGCTW